MAFVIPPLPYDYGALEPHIDTQTMNIHHAQPLPKRFVPASANASLKALKDPKVEFIVEDRSPAGSPPPVGPIIDQNRQWKLVWTVS